MLESPAIRLLTIALLVGGLFGLFVAHGTLEPAPDQHDYPGNAEVVADPDAYVGEQVLVSGPVVGTEPTVVALEGSEYVVADAPPAEAGQELWVFATVEADGTLTAHDGLARDQWESTYMYAISIVAVLWVLARGLRHWRIDLRRLTIEPRPTPPTRPPEEQSPSRSGEHDG